MTYLFALSQRSDKKNISRIAMNSILSATNRENKITGNPSPILRIQNECEIDFLLCDGKGNEIWAARCR